MCHNIIIEYLKHIIILIVALITISYLMTLYLSLLK